MTPGQTQPQPRFLKVFVHWKDGSKETLDAPTTDRIHPAGLFALIQRGVHEVRVGHSMTITRGAMSYVTEVTQTTPEVLVLEERDAS